MSYQLLNSTQGLNTRVIPLLLVGRNTQPSIGGNRGSLGPDRQDIEIAGVRIVPYSRRNTFFFALFIKIPPDLSTSLNCTIMLNDHTKGYVARIHSQNTPNVWDNS